MRGAGGKLCQVLGGGIATELKYLSLKYGFTEVHVDIFVRVCVMYECM